MNTACLDYFKIPSEPNLTVQSNSPTSQNAKARGFKGQEHLGYLFRLSENPKPNAKQQPIKHKIKIFRKLGTNNLFDNSHPHCFE